MKLNRTPWSKPDPQSETEAEEAANPLPKKPKRRPRKPKTKIRREIHCRRLRQGLTGLTFLPPQTPNFYLKMSAISKDDVLNLREKTGAGLIDCKRALVESGDLDEAVSILRKKGVASAAKKAGRDAGEGIIAQCVSADKSKGVLVEVNCETDFVAKNEDFVAFANGVAQRLLDEPEADLESERTEQVAKIGENIRISRSQGLEPKDKGLVESYVHTDPRWPYFCP